MHLSELQKKMVNSVQSLSIIGITQIWKQRCFFLFTFDCKCYEYKQL